jgi:ubiquinone/menaquinone biosynthesis C-methylase UbiE
MSAAAQEDLVNEAFSRQSPVFDAIDRENSIIVWMRERIRKEVLHFLPENANMLELNCGTGLDAIFFASHGHKVLATDNADGMLEQTRRKLQSLNLQDKVTVRQCSFNNLEQLYGMQFDYVFSNFGGLNCSENLGKILNDISQLLKPGGRFTLVIMPTVCPWEIVTIFKGYFRTAFRRFKKHGATAHLEGEHFKCYYYDPGYVLKVLGEDFKLLSLKGLSITVPPPFIENFMEKHPKVFRMLEYIENAVLGKTPFNRWCDHYMITMEKE